MMKSMPYVSRITYHASRLRSNVSGKLDAGLLLAALLTLFIIQSLLQPGLPTLADLPIHLYRTLEYGQAWSSGVIVPRWAPNLAYGYGYPLFIFAPPLPYWLGLAFQAIGLTLESALRNLIILTILLYAIGMYLLGREVWGSVEAGLVAATAYAFAPFSLREALLYGGNIPQFLAIGLFPWTLWAMTRAARTRSWRWGGLAACFYASILLSHLFQALIFTPVVGLFGLIVNSQWSVPRGGYALVSDQKSVPRGGYALASSQKSVVSSQRSGQGSENSQFTIHNLLFAIRHSPFPLPSPHALVTIPLGLLLTAFFWLPAFTERFFTRAQADIYLEKSPFFVRYPHWTELIAWIYPLDARAANPYAPLTLGVVTLILAVLGLAVGIRDWRLEIKTPTLNPQSPSTVYRLPSTLFFAAVAAAAIFLTLPNSRSIWEVVTILQVAEFPWRMLGLANLGLALLAGAAVLWLPPKLRRPLTIICLLAQIIAVAPYLYPVTAFTSYGQVTIADQIDYERRSQSIGTTTLGEYLPQTVTRPPTTSPLVEAFQANQYPERLDYGSLPAGATATLLKQNAVTHAYNLNSPTDFTLRLFQFDYPGWQAQLDREPALIRPEAETGLILINIPAGQHTLTVHFGETPGRIAAIALTGLTLVGLIGAVVVKWSTQSRRSGPQRPRPSIGSRLSAPVNSQRLTREGDSPKFPPAPLAAMLLIIIAAFWLKPLLRPVFTIDSPPDQALPAQHQTQINFKNGIQLIGYDLDQRVVRAGERLQVVLYWQTKAAPIRANLQPFVHLDRLDNFTTVTDATNYTPGDVTTESNLPTFHWDNARYIRDEHDLIVPPDTPPLAYAVRVGLIDPDQQGRLLPLADGSGDTAQLAIINVASTPEQPSKLAESLEISFHPAIHLTGYELETPSPEQLEFKLAWRTDQPLPANYTVFAQLLDLENNLVAGFDRPPLDGAYPTSTWLPGQTIIDPRSIPLNHVPAGEYRLIVGLYNPTTQQRLLTTTGADFVELTRVKIDEQ
jgi:hypothetical protein